MFNLGVMTNFREKQCSKVMDVVLLNGKRGEPGGRPFLLQTINNKLYTLVNQVDTGDEWT